MVWVYRGYVSDWSLIVLLFVDKPRQGLDLIYPSDFDSFIQDGRKQLATSLKLLNVYAYLGINT